MAIQSLLSRAIPRSVAAVEPIGSAGAANETDSDGVVITRPIFPRNDNFVEWEV